MRERRGSRFARKGRTGRESSVLFRGQKCTGRPRSWEEKRMVRLSGLGLCNHVNVF